MVLDQVKITDGDQVSERLAVRLDVQRRHEVADDGRGHLRCLREPAQERLPSPVGHVYQPIDLRDNVSFQLPNRAEHGAATPDQLLGGVFVGLRDPEVNRHHHGLVRPSPRPQRRPGGQRALGKDDAIADHAEALAQSVAKEHLMPVPVPGDVSRSAAPLKDKAAEAEDGDGERPAPRERCDKRSGLTARLEIAT